MERSQLTVQDLPEELLSVGVFRHLGAKDVVLFAQLVCKKWKAAGDTPLLWEYLAKDQWAEEASNLNERALELGWRETYKEYVLTGRWHACQNGGYTLSEGGRTLTRILGKEEIWVPMQLKIPLKNGKYRFTLTVTSSDFGVGLAPFNIDGYLSTFGWALYSSGELYAPNKFLNKIQRDSLMGCKLVVDVNFDRKQLEFYSTEGPSELILATIDEVEAPEEGLYFTVSIAKPGGTLHLHKYEKL